MIAAPADHLHQLVGEDLPARCPVAETRRLDRGHAEVVPVFHGRVAERYSDANRELLVRAAVAALEPLLHRDPGRDRRGAALEDGHDPVTGVLDLTSTGAVGGLTQDLEVLATQVVCGRRAHPCLQPRRAHEVTDEDGDGFYRGHSASLAPPSHTPGRPPTFTQLCQGWLDSADLGRA